MSERTRCRTCPAEIIWARTDTGALMPVDAEPDPAGNVLVMQTAHGPQAFVLGKGKEPDPRGTVHQSHWATCTNPPKRNRRKR